MKIELGRSRFDEHGGSLPVKPPGLIVDSAAKGGKSNSRRVVCRRPCEGERRADNDCNDRMAAWWNGRHWGLKIPSSVTGVWVRIPPRPLASFRILLLPTLNRGTVRSLRHACFVSTKNTEVERAACHESPNKARCGRYSRDLQRIQGIRRTPLHWHEN